LEVDDQEQEAVQVHFGGL